MRSIAAHDDCELGRKLERFSSVLFSLLPLPGTTQTPSPSLSTTTLELPHNTHKQPAELGIPPSSKHLDHLCLPAPSTRPSDGAAFPVRAVLGFHPAGPWGRINSKCVIKIDPLTYARFATGMKWMLNMILCEHRHHRIKEDYRGAQIRAAF